MAKGGSRLATAGRQCQESAGEHRRAVAGQRCCLVPGTGDADQVAPVGDRRSRSVGSMTSTTSSPTPPSSWLRGSGSGATGGQGRPESMEWHLARSSSAQRICSAGLRDDLKARRFEPLPVRERMIPKSGGKLRRLGIPTARDRVVQAALKLVLEPIFEADCVPRTQRRRRCRRSKSRCGAVPEMEVGPPGSPCRGRSQTTASCVGQEPGW